MAGPADGLPWDNPEAAIPGNDPAAAMATLDAAGWSDTDGDGTHKKDGLRAAFQVLYPAGDSTRQALALGASDQLREIGIDAAPRGSSWDEIDALIHAQVVVFGWGAHDPSEITDLHHGDSAGADDHNPGYDENPAVDAHLDDAEAANSFDASLAAWGLDQPATDRFASWLGQFVRGNLGQSITFNAPVAQVIAARLPGSLALIALARAQNSDKRHAPGSRGAGCPRHHGRLGGAHAIATLWR